MRGQFKVRTIGKSATVCLVLPTLHQASEKAVQTLAKNQILFIFSVLPNEKWVYTLYSLFSARQHF
jgi:hypothetical protein